jgi:predicted phage tail protein
MLTVILYGHLATAYGKIHKLNVRTPAEAIQAFCVNYPDFAKRVVGDGKKQYKVLAGKDDRSNPDGLHLPTSKTIKIVPLLTGHGKSGGFLLGVAMIGLSLWLPGSSMMMGLSGSSFAAASFGVSMLSSIGWSMALGGVSQMLFGAPSTKVEAAKRSNNHVFSGPINTTGQGRAVPVAYGEVVVGSQTISVGLVAEKTKS